MFAKGDILLASKRGFKEGRHYIVVWNNKADPNSGVDFLGIMLTHSTKYKDNILMERTHIDSTKLFAWNNTHFVNQVFIKLSDWGPFLKVSSLTNDGISFINKNLTNNRPTTYLEYISS